MKNKNIKKPKRRLYFLCLSLLVSLFTFEAYSQRDTEDYWKCTSRSGGEWNFGRAPSVCDIYHFADTVFTTNNYPEFLFIDDEARADERERYMTQMYTLLNHFIDFYFNRRKPNASAQEKSYFKKALFALFHQESFWSHYRITDDQKLKYMRGDRGHGHGIGQIDDRWHFVEVQDGTAARLVSNLVYALDIYFESWERAVKASCVKGSSDYVSRLRAAYSAYNGGKSKLCRWSNPDDRWYGNDKAYYQKYQLKRWDRYIRSKDEDLNLDFECLAEGKKHCPRQPNLPIPAPPVPRSDVLYVQKNEYICHFNDNAFNCFKNNDDQACFIKTHQLPKSIASIPLETSFKQDYKMNMQGRHYLCQNIEGHFPISEHITLKKNIFQRSTPSGEVLHLVPMNTTLQVLDFLYELPNYERHYKVKYKGVVGFIYAGSENDYAHWASKASSSESVQGKIIASINDKVQVHKNLNLRSKDLQELSIVAKESILTVKGLWINGENNSLRYFVNYKGQDGYVYSGVTKPTTNIEEWSSIVKGPIPNEPLSFSIARLKRRYWYTLARQCPRFDCKTVFYILGPKLSSRTFRVSLNATTDPEWVKVSSGDRTGFIKANLVEHIK